MYISEELKQIADIISCNFVDAKMTSKKFVSLVEKQFGSSEPPNNGFIISTCLRFERYTLSSENPEKNLFYSKGRACIHRLLSVLVGLQSEIVGEKEIFIQITKSIEDHYLKGLLDETFHKGLLNLLSIAEDIRTDNLITVEENYSTIGASFLANYIKDNSKVCVFAIGGGYMVESFIQSLDTPIYKFVWANRSISKIENKINSYKELAEIIEVHDLTTCKENLTTADFIFCAISNSEDYFKGVFLKEGAVVVDVSYPQVFSESKKIRLINIANTSFDSLLKFPVTKDRIMLANKAIDSFINELYDNL